MGEKVAVTAARRITDACTSGDKIPILTPSDATGCERAGTVAEVNFDLPATCG